MRPALAIFIAIVASAPLAACGEDEPKHTPVTPASDFFSPEDGIAFRAPKGATVADGDDEQVVVLRRGESTLTISRFARDGQNLPNSRRELVAAAEALPEEYVKHRGSDPDRVKARLAPPLAGHEAVFVSDGLKLHYHLYEYGNEFVIDTFAPGADSARATALLFRPVLSTLKISEPRDK